MILSPSHFIDLWQSLTVLVLGDVMLDRYLHGTADRLCQEAPVPVVEIAEQQDFPGGAANVAANVSCLGARTLLLSALGQDEAGERLRSQLQQRQVSTNHLLTRFERSTLTKQRVVANNHLLARLDQGSTHALDEVLEKKIIQHLIDLFHLCDAVIISDYGYGTITPQIIQTLEQLQKKYHQTLVIDSKTLKAYQAVNASVVKPNYGETIKLLGLPALTRDRVDQIWPHSHTLLQLTGAERVAVTLDRDGVLMFEHNQPAFHCPTQPAPTHHTSGAGDTFISALTLALAAQAPTMTATSIATTATTIAVAQPGTTVCTAADLRQAMQSTEDTVPTPINTSAPESRRVGV